MYGHLLSDRETLPCLFGQNRGYDRNDSPDERDVTCRPEYMINRQ